MVPSFSLIPSGSWTRRLGGYALYAVGALVGLWGMVQATALVPSAKGSEPSEREAVASPSTSSDAGIDVFTWGNLSALLLLLGGGGYALYMRRRVSGDGGANALRSVGQLTLGQTQQLRLVACGDEVLLLGATEEAVELLKTYPRDAFADDVLDVAEGGGAPPGSGPPTPSSSGHFAEVMKQFARRNSLS